MKRAALLLILTCAGGVAFAQDPPVSGAALAQQSAASPVFEPQWEERPEARAFARYTPEEVLTRGMPGVVHLCCTPRDDRRLDCRVAFEWPREHGFGSGAMRVMHGFRLTPESQAAFRADPNAWLQIPIVFEPRHPPPEFQDISSRISEATRGLCAPSGVDPGPAVEPIVVTVG